MNLKFKIPKLSLKKSFKKGSYEIDPNLYWQAILFAVLLMIIIACVYGFFLFRRVNQDLVLSVDSADGSMGTSQVKKINQALEYFEARASKSQNIKSSPSPLVDPSL